MSTTYKDSLAPGADVTYGGSFLPQHVAKLKSSAITAETKMARGYSTVTEKATLERAGFAPSQRRVPGILIPLHGVTGKPAGYQYRPDDPRLRKGKPIKYETPQGQRLVIDVPPACQADLDYPNVELWITEGPLKADAAATIGLCCVALLGVYGWRGTNRDKGKAALPDWESIALNDRQVVLAFDSDAYDKASVWDALNRLAQWLRLRGAHVRYLRLEAQGDDKLGLDDAIAAGATIEDLQAMVHDDLGPRPVGDATEPIGPDGHHYTDMGNADRLVALHGDVMRYVPAWKAWLHYDGQRWQIDHGNVRAIELAGDVPRKLWRDLPDMSGEARTRQLKWATRCEDARKLEAMVKLARGALTVDHNQLDADGWLLNCENGAVDLRTGDLRPHDPEAMATKLAPVRYDPEARAPVWDAFLERILPDREVRLFVQQAVGYSLTGDVGEQVLFLLVGEGANGKSTLVSTVSKLLGDYAATAPEDLLLATRHNPHPTGLTDLHGARFVAAVETEAGARLAEAQVKRLTGGDTIKARRMREDYWHFEPTHKLWLAANHLPRITGEDHAIWRRIRLVPFTETIPKAEQDPNLAAKLAAEMPGILLWAVEGCLLWQALEGLQVPSAVTSAVNAYRAEEDWLHRFAEEAGVEFGAGRWAASSILTEKYQRWAKEAGERPVGAKAFGVKLRQRGAEPCKANGARGWSGVSCD